MTMKLIAASALALAMTAGAAFAQTQATEGGDPANTTASTNTDSMWASDEERMMYEDNRDTMVVFFTDDTMSELKPEAEIQAAFEAMGADSQAEMKTACERASQGQSGSYGSVTTALCAQAGVEM